MDIFCSIRNPLVKLYIHLENIWYLNTIGMSLQVLAIRKRQKLTPLELNDLTILYKWHELLRFFTKRNFDNLQNEKIFLLKIFSGVIHGPNHLQRLQAFSMFYLNTTEREREKYFLSVLIGLKDVYRSIYDYGKEYCEHRVLYCGKILYLDLFECILLFIKTIHKKNFYTSLSQNTRLKFARFLDQIISNNLVLLGMMLNAESETKQIRVMKVIENYQKILKELYHNEDMNKLDFFNNAEMSKLIVDSIVNNLLYLIMIQKKLEEKNSKLFNIISKYTMDAFRCFNKHVHLFLCECSSKTPLKYIYYMTGHEILKCRRLQVEKIYEYFKVNCDNFLKYRKEKNKIFLECWNDKLKDNIVFLGFVKELFDAYDKIHKLDVPDKFVDFITQEVLYIPARLESSKQIVDISTFYYLYITIGFDPFNRQMFKDCTPKVESTFGAILRLWLKTYNYISIYDIIRKKYNSKKVKKLNL